MASTEDQIRALYQDLLHAWNRRDAEAMASLFAEDGYLVGFDGSTIDRPAEIVSHLKPIFASHPTAAYVSIVRSVRFLVPDVAALLATAGMVAPGKSELNPAVNAIQSLVAVKRGGVWRIAVYQNTPAAFHGRPELADKLTAELREVLHASPPKVE
jgi:uncharacterized protein (TIGR02246 family)